MSHAFERLEIGPARFDSSQPMGFRQPQLCHDDLTHLGTQVALDMVAESIVFFSAPSRRLIHVNREASRCLGYTQQQLQRKSLLDVAPQATGANLAEICRRAIRSATQETRVRTAYRHRNGSLRLVHCCIRALRIEPESLFVAVAQENTVRCGTYSPRLSAAFRDSLTLLPNRAWLWRQLEREVRSAQKSDYRYAVLFIDIDRFKEINDSYGHLAGDRVLEAVAGRLKASVRPNDVITRYGGDEFVVLMKDVGSGDDIRRIAERIGRCVETVGKGRKGEEWRARVTVSIGVAISGGQGASAVDAVERADGAMYRAKALGRNGQFVIDEAPHDFRRSTKIRAEFSDRIRQFE